MTKQAMKGTRAGRCESCGGRLKKEADRAYDGSDRDPSTNIALWCTRCKRHTSIHKKGT